MYFEYETDNGGRVRGGPQGQKLLNRNYRLPGPAGAENTNCEPHDTESFCQKRCVELSMSTAGVGTIAEIRHAVTLIRVTTESEKDP